MLAMWLLMFVLLSPVPDVIQDAPHGVTGVGQLWFDTASSTLKYCATISESPSAGTQCTSWSAVPGGAPGGLPTGAIIFISSGTCPSGTTEAADLDGQMFQATRAANNNVGTTGGSNSITPAGTNSAPALTMNSYTPAGTQGSPTIADHASHTHTITQSSFTNTQKFSTGTGSSPTAYTAGGIVTSPSGGPSATLTHSVTAPGTFTGTPATLTGTVAAPTFTGSAFDPHPQFTRLIPCRAN